METPDTRERWIVARLLDDHINSESIEIRIYKDSQGRIIDVSLKTQNGLTHFGTKVHET